ncbi:MAG: hypothetical protein H6Q18_46 [Bacteroidetes bacterium]|nr:hypothetical protein [Bacteroidota bacterium]
MSQSITLEIIDDKVKVVSPYNEGFVNKCRNLRGTFKGGAWWFDDSIIDYVREAMVKYFGTTGETPFETCSLVISDFSDSGDCGPVTLFGRTIARAWGRDSGAKLGDDIIFVSGNYSSGGSVKNWRTYVSDATFEIQNFPIPSLELSEVKAAIEEGWCTVKYSQKKRKREDIEADILVCKAQLIALENELKAINQ